MAIKYFKPLSSEQRACIHKDIELVSAQLIQEKPKIIASVNYKCKGCGVKIQTDGNEKIDKIGDIKVIATEKPIEA